MLSFQWRLVGTDLTLLLKGHEVVRVSALLLLRCCKWDPVGTEHKHLSSPHATPQNQNAS